MVQISRKTRGNNKLSRKEDFVDAARRHFAVHGYAVTSTRDICLDLGVVPSAIYNYFESKEHLLYELIVTSMEQMQQESDHMLGAMRSTAPLERLRALVRFTLECAITRQAEWRIMIDELRNLKDPKFQRDIVRRRDAYDSQVQDLIAKCVQDEAVGPIDYKLAGFGMSGVAEGICHWYRPDGSMTAAQIVAFYTDFVLRGIGVRAP